MIEQISSVMTSEQIDEIANLIREQFYKYRNYIKSQAYQDLFPEEYKPHKEAHTVSWAITGAFPSGKIVAGFRVSRLKYGRGHTRPQLSNENVVFHILNKSSDFKAQYLKPYYAMNKNGFQGHQIYCYFQFSVKKNWLESLDLCLPDEAGTVVAQEQLFVIPHIVADSA